MIHDQPHIRKPNTAVPKVTIVPIYKLVTHQKVLTDRIIGLQGSGPRTIESNYKEGVLLAALKKITSMIDIKKSYLKAQRSEVVVSLARTTYKKELKKFISDCHSKIEDLIFFSLHEDGSELFIYPRIGVLYFAISIAYERLGDIPKREENLLKSIRIREFEVDSKPI